MISETILYEIANNWGVKVKFGGGVGGFIRKFVAQPVLSFSTLFLMLLEEKSLVWPQD